jgi:membrane protease YdiL (CAAX protease family)
VIKRRRLGWGADHWAVAAAIAVPSLVTLVYFVWLAEGTSRWQQLAYALGKAVQFALPVAWVGLVQRASVRPRRPVARGWGLGIAFGLTAVGAMFVLYAAALRPQGWLDVAADQIVLKVRGFGVNSSVGYLALGTFYALIHSGLEEYYWRWFVFGQLSRMISVSAAAITSSLGFMIHHVILLGVYFGWTSPLTYLFSVAVAIGGLFWAWLYDRSGSIYAAWVSHLIVDAGIFLLGYDIVRSQFH